MRYTDRTYHPLIFPWIIDKQDPSQRDSSVSLYSTSKLKAKLISTMFSLYIVRSYSTQFFISIPSAFYLILYLTFLRTELSFDEAMPASKHDPENLRSTTLSERRFNDLRKEANQEDQRSRIDHRENEEEHHRTEQRAAFKTHREYSRRTKFVQPITRHCLPCCPSRGILITPPTIVKANSTQTRFCTFSGLFHDHVAVSTSPLRYYFQPTRCSIEYPFQVPYAKYIFPPCDI